MGHKLSYDANSTWRNTHKHITNSRLLIDQIITGPAKKFVHIPMNTPPFQSDDPWVEYCSLLKNNYTYNRNTIYVKMHIGHSLCGATSLH
jgi:hypothetical protein